MKLPWVGWHDGNGWNLSAWRGETRDVLVTGARDPHGELPETARVYEFSEGTSEVDKHAIAREAGGIVVIVFARAEPFGPTFEPKE